MVDSRPGVRTQGVFQRLSISTLLEGPDEKGPHEPIGLNRACLAGNRETHPRESGPPAGLFPLGNAQVHDIAERRLFAVDRG